MDIRKQNSSLKMQEKVSIIISCFNKDNYIAETIESVINQTSSAWELIVIDDVSNDKSVEIIEKFAYQDKRIRFFRNQSNRGANYSRNYGASLSTGDYLIFLDADDLLLNTCVETRLKYVSKNNLDMVVFAMGVFKQHIGDSKGEWIPYHEKPLASFMAHDLPWSILQPIWKKSFFQAVGRFNENFKRLQDVELHTRALLMAGIRLLTVTDIMDCFYRIDQERQNFNNILFLERWVESAHLYYFTFLNEAKDKNLDKNLIGTIYKTYLNILYYKRKGYISKEFFLLLKSKLIDEKVKSTLSLYKRLCLKTGCLLNELPFKIPGVNAIFFNLLTS